MLDELDRELECRGHRFVRYAGDCNIYVRSELAGQRVMQSITRFITQKLKLKVNDFCAGDFGVQPNATPPGDHFRLAAFVHRGRD